MGVLTALVPLVTPADAHAGPSPLPAPGSAGVGLQAGPAGSDPVVSGDGRRIVYVAASPDAAEVAGADAAFPARDSVWLFDRADGSTSELTTLIPGTRPGNSVHPVISADGCTVAVVTEIAYDLFRDDDRGTRWDVYRTVLPGCPGAFGVGEWELVSTTPGTNPAATDGADPTDRPALNASGSVIAFTRTTVPPAGSAARWSTIDVADVTVAIGDPGRISAVPGLPATPPTSPAHYVGQREPALSADGRYLAFTTDSAPTEAGIEQPPLADGTAQPPLTRIDAAWTDRVAGGQAMTDVLRWDRMPNTDDGGALLVNVSVGAGGSPAGGSSGTPAIDQRGDVVAFVSTAPDLVSRPDAAVPLPVGVPQVYRRDLGAQHAVTTLISEREGIPGGAASSAPALDATGRLVAFTTRAGDLAVPAAPAGDATGGDVLLADTEQGSVRRVTTRPDGQPGRAAAGSPSISTLGRIVVFASGAPGDLVGPLPAADPAHGPQIGRIVVADLAAELSTTALDMGTTAVGAESPVWYTTIVNDGAGGFVPAEIRSTDPAFAIVGGSCAAGVVIAPGGSCTVEITFRPDATGEAHAELVVAERGFGAAGISVPVSANGGIPVLDASPSASSFGESVVGLAGVPATVVFTNYGELPEMIASVGLGGTHPGDFAIAGDRCTSVLLQPGQSCEITVGFVPAGDGPRSATIRATTQAGATASAVVVGRGIYTPLAGTAQAAVVTGSRIAVSGLGFPANSYLSVGWTGTDVSVLVLSSSTGEIAGEVRVPGSLGTGRRTLTVVDPLARFTPVVTADVLVTARTGGANSAAHRSS